MRRFKGSKQCAEPLPERFKGSKRCAEPLLGRFEGSKRCVELFESLGQKGNWNGGFGVG